MEYQDRVKYIARKEAADYHQISADAINPSSMLVQRLARVIQEAEERGALRERTSPAIDRARIETTAFKKGYEKGRDEELAECSMIVQRAAIEAAKNACNPSFSEDDRKGWYYHSVAAQLIERTIERRRQYAWGKVPADTKAAAGEEPQSDSSRS